MNTLCISSSGWIINKDQGGSKILHPSLSRVTDPWIYFLLCTLHCTNVTLSLIVQRKSNITCKTLIARACSHKQFSVKGFALWEETISMWRKLKYQYQYPCRKKTGKNKQTKQIWSTKSSQVGLVLSMQWRQKFLNPSRKKCQKNVI